MVIRVVCFVCLLMVEFCESPVSFGRFAGTKHGNRSWYRILAQAMQVGMDMVGHELEARYIRYFISIQSTSLPFLPTR